MQLFFVCSFVLLWLFQVSVSDPAPFEEQIDIYKLLFEEGVVLVKKDIHMPKHTTPADKNVPVKAIQALWS